MFVKKLEILGRFRGLMSVNQIHQPQSRKDFE
jgi:hypothetical protein